MISDKKVKLQITITKELDKVLNEIVEKSKATGQNATKSQLAEIALRVFITQNRKKEL